MPSSYCWWSKFSVATTKEGATSLNTTRLPQPQDWLFKGLKGQLEKGKDLQQQLWAYRIQCTINYIPCSKVSTKRSWEKGLDELQISVDGSHIYARSGTPTPPHPTTAQNAPPDAASERRGSPGTAKERNWRSVVEGGNHGKLATFPTPKKSSKDPSLNGHITVIGLALISFNSWWLNKSILVRLSNPMIFSKHHFRWDNKNRWTMKLHLLFLPNTHTLVICCITLR